MSQTYKVRIVIQRTMASVVEVEADNEEEAEQLAVEKSYEEDSFEEYGDGDDPGECEFL